MLHAITILAAMSAGSGLMGHGKHCGGRMHHSRGAVMAQPSAPMMSCGVSASGYAMPTSSPMMSPQAPMMGRQGSTMGNMMSRPTAPVYATPSASDVVPPAPSVPPSPSAPSAPAPPAPSGT